MAIPDSILENLSRVPDVDGVGIVLRREDGGRQLDIRDFQMDLSRLRRCRAYVLAIESFASWMAAPDGGVDRVTATMEALAEALRKGRRAEAAIILDRLVDELGLLSFLNNAHEGRLRLAFVAAYHENPTWTAVIATGAAVSITLLSVTLGIVQIQQTYTAAECKERAGEIMRIQMEIIEAMHHREGRMTPQLLAALKIVADAGQVASSRCGSTLHGLEIDVTVPPGIHLEFRIRGDAKSYGR